MQPHSGDGADQPVGDLRRKLAAELGFLSILPPATHHIVSSSGLLGAVVQPAIQLVQKQADVGGIVLEIAIHRHNHPASGGLDPGGHRGGLPEVPAESDHSKRRLLPADPDQRGEGSIPTPVVDHDHLERLTDLSQGVEEL